MESLRNKLLKYDIVYGDFIKFCQTDYHRDFEVFTNTTFNSKKLKILIKGVVKVEYAPKAKGYGYTLDNRYLEQEFKGNINAYHWGIRSFELRKWTLEDNSEDITALQNDYDFKLFKITFDINSSDVSFIFHDLDIEELN